MTTEETKRNFCEAFDSQLTRYGYNGKLGKDLDKEYLKLWTKARIELLRKQADWFDCFNDLADKYLEFNNSQSNG